MIAVLLLCTVYVNASSKLAVLISHSRLTRNYLAESDFDASYRMMEALSSLHIPPRLKANLRTAAQVPRNMHVIGKKALKAMLTFPLKSDKVQEALDEFISYSEASIKSFVSVLYPKDTAGAMSKVKAAASQLKAHAKTILKKPACDIQKAYNIFEASRYFKSQSLEVMNTVVSKLIEEIGRVPSPSTTDLLSVEVYASLMGTGSLTADRLAVACDMKLNEMLVRSAKPERLMTQFRMCKLAWQSFYSESFVSNIFLRLTNLHFFSMALPILRGKSNFGGSSLWETYLFYDRLVAAKKISGETLSPLFEELNRLSEATQWWTMRPIKSELSSQLSKASDKYFPLRLRECRLNEDKHRVLTEMITLASS